MPEENEKLERRQFRKRLGSYVFATCVVILFYFLLRNSRSVSTALDYFNKVLQPIFIGFVQFLQIDRRIHIRLF